MNIIDSIWQRFSNRSQGLIVLHTIDIERSISGYLSQIVIGSWSLARSSQHLFVDRVHDISRLRLTERAASRTGLRDFAELYVDVVEARRYLSGNAESSLSGQIDVTGRLLVAVSVLGEIGQLASVLVLLTQAVKAFLLPQSPFCRLVLKRVVALLRYPAVVRDFPLPLRWKLLSNWNYRCWSRSTIDLFVVSINKIVCFLVFVSN